MENGRRHSDAPIHAAVAYPLMPTQPIKPALRRAAKYRQIMASLLARIESGEFQVGDQIPSEHQLVAELSVSRMTVNRALSELAAKGHINRVQGLGSFVADTRPQSSLLDVQDIARDIEQRGHQHQCRVIKLAPVLPGKEVAAALETDGQAQVFHSVLVHLESGVPVQLEERFVHPEFAHDYLAQDFERITPYSYLTKQGNIDEVEHTLQAGSCTPEQSQLLEIDNHQPCLVLMRRTWSNKKTVTFGRFIYPGNRYRLFSRYALTTLGRTK